MIINKLIIIKNLNQRDYFLCFNISVKSKFDGWIKNINIFSQDKKNIISNLLLTRRKSIRMSEREKKEFLNLDLDILENKTIESNNFNDHLISLKEYNNDDSSNFIKSYDDFNQINNYNNKDYAFEDYNLNSNNNIYCFNKADSLEKKFMVFSPELKKKIFKIKFKI